MQQGLSSGQPSPIPWWVKAIVILSIALTAMGGAIALIRPEMLVSPEDVINGAVRIYAGYLAARSFGIAIALTTLLVAGARRALGNIMALSGFIQLLDFCMDVAEKRWTVAPGVLVLGLLCLMAAARLSGKPFWRLAAWA
jgi:hypothetical protein